MRNRQVGPDTATAILEALVPRITYKPGWLLDLQEIDRGQGCQGLTLMISATVPDTCDLGKTVTFMHLFPVIPAAYDEENWMRWILEQILLVEQHEALEWFRRDGEQPYFPPHAPGRNPYTIEQIRPKTTEEAFAAAIPWNGGPCLDPHFTR